MLSYSHSHIFFAVVPIKMYYALAVAVFVGLAGLAQSVPTDTTTCFPRQVIKDGGFESGQRPSTFGRTPWTVKDVIGASTYSLTSPGSTNNGGKYAFTAKLYPSPSSAGASGLTLTQKMQTCAGQNYSILTDYKFESAANNDCSVSIQYPYKDIIGSVTTGSAISPAGEWSFLVGFFQAVSSADPFYVVFKCSNGANNRISVDNVEIKPFQGNVY